MKIGIIGCGVMGSAFARRWAKKGYSLRLFDRFAKSVIALAEEIGAEVAPSASEAANGADFLLLAIKPKDFADLSEELKGMAPVPILSILAGVSLAHVKEAFPKMLAIRLMPNLALTCGESVIALVEDPTLTKEVRAKTAEIMEGLGLTLWVKEEQIDGVTALAGSGPAYVLSILEAMVEAGVVMGLSASMAKELAMQTMLGSVALLKEQGGHPGAIRWQISSPGGTTIAGQKAFEEAGVRAGIYQTFLAAFERAKGVDKEPKKR